MAPSAISAIAVIVSQLLFSVFGIELGNESLTQALTTFIAIAAGIIVWYRQKITGRSNAFGGRPRGFRE